MEFHVITARYMALIHSTDESNMNSYQEIKAERQAFILSRKPLVPGTHCHNCAWKLPVKGHFCSGACADDYEQEKAELLARDGK